MSVGQSDLLRQMEELVEDLRRKIEEVNDVRPGEEVVRDLFRYFHSLKSAAAFAGQEDIAEYCHAKETRLERLRSGDAASWNKASFEEAVVFLSEMLSRFRWDLKLSESAPADRMPSIAGPATSMDAAASPGSLSPLEPLNAPEAPDPPDIAPHAGFSASKTGALPLSDFDIVLLKEARNRGEVFYRTRFRIVELPSMTRARVQLLLDKLERTVNVVKVHPRDFEPSVTESGAFHESERAVDVGVYYTTRLAIRDLLRSAVADNIAAEETVLLDYAPYVSPKEGSAVLETVGTAPSDQSAPEYLEVRTDVFDRLSDYEEALEREIRGLFLGLKREKSADDPLFGILDELKDTQLGLRRTIRRAGLKPLRSLFERLDAFVREQAVRLGKKVRFRATGGEIPVDARSSVRIHDSVLHLVRNALDHGIEPPSERAVRAKSEEGSLSASARQENGRVIIEVADDGRGIDEERIRSLAEKQGAPDAQSGPLLDLICRSGFSTKEAPDRLSGRGLGLDLVRLNIASIPDGLLELEQEKGRGCRFRISFPENHSVFSVVLFFAEGRTWAVPERNVAGQERFDPDLVRSAGNGLPVYGDSGLPLYSVRGRLADFDRKQASLYALVLRHQDKRGLLLVEETGLTRDVSYEDIGEAGQENPYVGRVALGGSDSALFLNPALIS